MTFVVVACTFSVRAIYGEGCVMDEALRLEREGWRALATSAARARHFYEDVLADDPLMLLPGGIVLAEREAILEAMSGDPWAWFLLEDERVLPVSHDVAVVAYRAAAQRRGQPEYQALCASTYTRADGTWRMVTHQQTPV